MTKTYELITRSKEAREKSKKDIETVNRNYTILNMFTIAATVAIIIGGYFYVNS